MELGQVDEIIKVLKYSCLIELLDMVTQSKKYELNRSLKSPLILSPILVVPTITTAHE